MCAGGEVTNVTVTIHRGRAAKQSMRVRKAMESARRFDTLS